ncbi:DUF455 family protein [Paenibacillus psychroresistens]|uniref:DUF455 family protein n=1 Tax=Paenibacillus psychroresistens TaxID=1778678 RepID=A0A6B8RQV8_9BACL|nr:DUF455 family protein [Paenibacillus psychroresistens]QGQ98389.1 DUF455 family protein [Paenibacillus psychroresistens]
MAEQIEEESFAIDIDQMELPPAVAEYGNVHLRPVDSNRRLKQLFWLEFELSRFAMGWAPCFPDWDIKGELMRLAYLHTIHMKALKERIGELAGGGINERARSPVSFREGFQSLSLAPGLAEFAFAYRALVQALLEAYRKLEFEMDPILDAPSLDIFRLIEMDSRTHLEWPERFIRFAYSEQPTLNQRYTSWTLYTNQVILTMQRHAEDKAVKWPTPLAIEAIGPVPAVAAPDVRFPLHDPKIHGEANLLRDSSSPLNDSVKQMIYINATEMTSAESMAYLYYGVQNMPMDFYIDVARHTWDEVRHSQMGVRRLKQLGFQTEHFLWAGTQALTSDNLPTIFPEFYATLTMVAEPCSFFKKRKSIDAFWKFGDALSAVQSEFDISDERMHVDFGQKWGAKLFEHMEDFETAKSVQEKVRAQRLRNVGVQETEIEQLLKNFPSLCGFTTKELVYDQY